MHQMHWIRISTLHQIYQIRQIQIRIHYSVRRKPTLPVSTPSEQHASLQIPSRSIGDTESNQNSVIISVSHQTVCGPQYELNSTFDCVTYSTTYAA